MKTLIHYKELSNHDAEVRERLDREIGTMLDGVLKGLLMLLALYAVLLWNMGSLLPDSFQYAFYTLIGPIGILIAIPTLGIWTDADYLDDMPVESNPLHRILGFMHWVLSIAQLFLMFGGLALIWDLSVGLADSNWWTTGISEWTDLPLLWPLAVHVSVAGQVAFLYARINPAACLGLSVILSPAVALMTQFERVIEGPVEEVLQLMDYPGVYALADLFGFDDVEADLCFSAGLMQLSFFVFLLILAVVAKNLIQGEELEPLVGTSGAASTPLVPAADGEYSSIGDFANVYRVVDLDDYEYFTERKRS